MFFVKWIFKLITFFSLLLLLCNCKLVEVPPLPQSAKIPSTFTESTDTTSIGDISWQTFFNDTYLTNLIDEALTNNLDLLSALQRIEVARANYQISRGALLPDLNASFGVQTGNLNNANKSEQVAANQNQNYFLGLQSSWEADLWGKLKSRRKAAFVRFLATQSGRHLIQTNLVAEVARLYYELLGLDYELETVQKNAKLQEKALEIMKIQKIGGRATELAVQQFHAQLLRTKSLGIEKQQLIIEVENQLNFILGRFSQPIVRGESILKQYLPEILETGVPSDMLLRRPDIQQAELVLIAANADVEAARAEFLPSFVITPFIGFQNAKLPILLQSPESITLGFISGLTTPLLSRNLLKSTYNQTLARNLEGFYSYQKALLLGYQEVVVNLKRVENFKKVFRLRKQETDVLSQAVSTSNDLFAAGYASYLEIITAQESVLAAELNMTNTRKEIFLASIDLYRALGGGWE